MNKLTLAAPNDATRYDSLGSPNIDQLGAKSVVVIIIDKLTFSQLFDNYVWLQKQYIIVRPIWALLDPDEPKLF